MTEQKRKKGFLSYAHEDRSHANRIYKDLSEHGISLWYDQKNFMPEQDTDDQILNAIKESYFIILLLSSVSVAKEGYIRKEIALALQMASHLRPVNPFLIPVRVEECHPNEKEIKGMTTFIDLYTNWNKGIEAISSLIPFENDQTDIENLSLHDIQTNISSFLYLSKTAKILNSRSAIAVFLQNCILKLKSVDGSVISRKITNMSKDIEEFAACIELHTLHQCGTRDSKTICKYCKAKGSIIHGSIDIGGFSQSDYNDNYVSFCEQCFWHYYDFEIDYLGRGPLKFDYDSNIYY